MTKEEVSVFQYNSCFCLSESSIIGGVVIHQFQYNSCFCLSKIKFFYRNNSFFISMQLLFLFIGAVIYVHDRNSCDFNTTLVFVYPTFLSHSSVSIISLNLDIFNVFQLFFPTGRPFSKLILKILCSPCKINVLDHFLNLAGWENYTVIYGQNMALFPQQPTEFQGLSSLPVPASPRIVLLFQQKT